MAAEKAFGPGQQTRLDKLTVTLPHPEAYIALLSGKSEITGHFGNAPFIYQELDNPKIHRLLSSEEILGGLGTVTSVFTTAKVRDANPKVYKAVLDGLRDAIDFINRDKGGGCRHLRRGGKVVADAGLHPEDHRGTSALYSTAPVNSFKFADFMLRTGTLKNRPRLLARLLLFRHTRPVGRLTVAAASVSALPHPCWPCAASRSSTRRATTW